ncbi:hypothetical protein EDC04DRAFT_2599549 [Pisolithus marmoratus]|nr:hypothetical protein EDC04DRAFT_2599549 [Pisolithus marmoratus]
MANLIEVLTKAKSGPTKTSAAIGNGLEIARAGLNQRLATTDVVILFSSRCQQSGWGLVAPIPFRMLLDEMWRKYTESVKQVIYIPPSLAISTPCFTSIIGYTYWWGTRCDDKLQEGEKEKEQQLEVPLNLLQSDAALDREVMDTGHWDTGGCHAECYASGTARRKFLKGGRAEWREHSIEGGQPDGCIWQALRHRIFLSWKFAGRPLQGVGVYRVSDDTQLMTMRGRNPRWTGENKGENSAEAVVSVKGNNQKTRFRRGSERERERREGGAVCWIDGCESDVGARSYAYRTADPLTPTPFTRLIDDNDDDDYDSFYKMDVDWCLSCDRRIDPLTAKGPYCSAECLSFAEPSSSSRLLATPPAVSATRRIRAPAHPSTSPLSVRSTKPLPPHQPELIKRMTVAAPRPTLSVSSPTQVRAFHTPASSRTYSQAKSTTPSEASTSLTSLLSEPMVVTPAEEGRFGTGIGALVPPWAHRDRTKSSAPREDELNSSYYYSLPPLEKGRSSSDSKPKKTPSPRPAVFANRKPPAKKPTRVGGWTCTPTETHTPTPVIFPSCRSFDVDWDEDGDIFIAPDSQCHPAYRTKQKVSHIEEEVVQFCPPSPSPARSASSTGSSILFMAPKRRDAVRGRLATPRA